MKQLGQLLDRAVRFLKNNSIKTYFGKRAILSDTFKVALALIIRVSSCNSIHYYLSIRDEAKELSVAYCAFAVMHRGVDSNERDIGE